MMHGGQATLGSDRFGGEVRVMKSYGKYSGIDAIALRVSRLTSVGQIVRDSPTGAFLLCCEGKASHTATVETGQALSKTGFCAGASCNSWETKDRVTGYTGELTVCNVSDELTEIIGASEGIMASVANGGAAAEQIIGSAYYETGSCSLAQDADGVVIEMWFRPVLCKSQIADEDGVVLWRKRIYPWAYNFVKTAADEVGDQFSDYVYSFKIKPPAPGFGSGPFNEDDFINPDVNDLAPVQAWSFVEYWTPTGPPECEAGVANYLATPALAS